MKQTSGEVIILQEDYNLLKRYFKTTNKKKFYQRLSCLNLRKELSKAIVLSKEEFPGKVVRLNSTVIVKDVDTNCAMAYTIVLPQYADKGQGKVSILSPIGIALIGFKKGLQFTWRFLSGKRNLSILEVYDSPSLNHY